ncbi:androgen induced inhibitor of proliferation (as3) / pds5, putative [Ricinus communis]|uniref:Androgen induced inhibitor of proliferation (As3) / pds5, putative n=1 Tax=Ricinus communis TaxID=3988 RepID=B9RJ83_RICCO|nr:androgen induced inhibitor of proliferation (as3) / pds5, putative [Ricinus communis]
MDESSLQLVSEIGIQLGRLARPNKDFLVKSLRQAANALAQIEPPSPPEASRKKEAVNKLASGIKPLGKSFVKHGLLRNSDKDVKLLVAICISEIFRILAPEPPFEDKYLRDVFKLILSMFAELADTTSPYFSRRVKILETVARCKCFVILLDIDCNDLVLEMFNIFFSIVRENHQRSLINDVLSIMTHILNEEASLPLSDVILRNLVKEGTAASAAASQLAASVIQSCAEKLEPFICGFLTSCSLDRDAIDSELKEFYHEILFKVFQCAPQMLLAVIPNLTQELLTDQVDVRIKAVNLIGRLFALPEHHVAEKYHNLFIEFKNRFSDKSVEVRLSALRCAKACYMANPSGKESSELLSAVEGRLLDFDDRVRILAVVVVCDLARFNLKYFSAELLSKAVERLRDKKISVRKKALQKLMEVYQEYCNKCSESYLTIGGHFEQIPCKILMLCYDKDCKEFRSQNMEPILAEDLFPARLSVEDRTRHWIHFFSLFTPLHVKALNSILSQKRRLQNEMQSYLALRKKEKESGSEEMQKRIKNSFMKMSASFPDPSKAEECFHKLNQMKDNNIFNSLELLLVERTIINAQTTRDKFLKMIGDKHPHFEFLQLLSSKCSFNIFSSEHVRCILDHLSSDAVGNGRLEASSANLLLTIINVFPSLLRGFEEQFRLLLQEKNMINDVLIEALAKAGPYISVKFSDFYPLLESACLEGTRIQSKQAVSAIASLIGSSEQLIFSKLCKELVDSLHRGWNTPTILQSLGCIAQHSVAAFESKYREIRSYIFQRIFQIYGVKTLVKSFLPHQGSHVNRQIDELLDILLKLLQTGDAIDGIITCVNDKPHVRLAAAKSVLRLSRRWDLHISPEIFRSTILVAKPFKYMEEFVKEYNIVARNRQNSAVQEGTVTDYPAYIVVFLIHTLAHSTGFPPEDSRDEQEYAHFCRPLFLVVQALLSANIANGDADLVNDAVMYLLSIFRAIKRAEDALDATKTPASLKCLNQFSVDESFVKRIVHSLKSQISMPASSLPKRGRKCQADGIQSAKYNTLNMAPLDHANLLRTETIDMQKLVSPDISLRHRKKSAASESVGLHNEVSRTNASKSSKSMKKDVSSSCDSATTRPSANESQTLIWTVDGTIPYLKESGRASSRLTAESSKRTTSKPNEPCCSRTFSTENEALIGKRVKLLSPVDRCFYSGTVVGFNPGNNTHKISYDSGEVELLCLDSESWETVSDSPTEKETTFADQHKKSHSSEWNLKETVNTFGDGATTQSNHLANKENEKVSNGMTSFPAKGRKGQKLSSDTPASVVTNNEDAKDSAAESVNSVHCCAIHPLTFLMVREGPG